MDAMTTLAFCVRARAHGNPQVCHTMPMEIHRQMPWKSTLSQSTLIGPGFASAHAYPPSRIQCHVDALEIHTRAGPGFANAHGHPQIFAVPWMPWKSTLSKSTLIGPGFANAHAYPPSLSQCHGCRLPWSSVLGLGARLCQCPWKSTNLCSAMDAMEIHTIPVYPYRARACQGPCISTNHFSSIIPVYPYRARKSTLSQLQYRPGCQSALGQWCQALECPWKST